MRDNERNEKGAAMSDERPQDLALGDGALAMSPAVADRTLRRLQWLRWGSMRWLAPLAIVALAAVAIATSHTPWEGQSRTFAVAGIVAALALVAAAGMRGGVVVALAIAGAVVFAASEGREPGFGMAHGWRCTAMEWAVAAGPLAALFWYSRREVLRFAPSTVAAVAAAGAMGGDAVLHVLCTGTELAPHVWLFHFGGLLVIALAAGLIAKRGRVSP